MEEVFRISCVSRRSVSVVSAVVACADRGATPPFRPGGRARRDADAERTGAVRGRDDGNARAVAAGSADPQRSSTRRRCKVRRRPHGRLPLGSRTLARAARLATPPIARARRAKWDGAASGDARRSTSRTARPVTEKTHGRSSVENDGQYLYVHFIGGPSANRSRPRSGRTMRTAVPTTKSAIELWPNDSAGFYLSISCYAERNALRDVLGELELPSRRGTSTGGVARRAATTRSMRIPLSVDSRRAQRYAGASSSCASCTPRARRKSGASIRSQTSGDRSLTYAGQRDDRRRGRQTGLPEAAPRGVRPRRGRLEATRAGGSTSRVGADLAAAHHGDDVAPRDDPSRISRTSNSTSSRSRRRPSPGTIAKSGHSSRRVRASTTT